MIKTLKTFVSTIAVLAFLAGCSSNTTVDEPTEPPQTFEEAADTSPSFDEPVDTGPDLSGVDTVFYFDFDQAILRPESRSALMIHAEALKASPRSIRLEGHADERGSREYNMALGERRANAVRDFLVLQGVDSYLVETVSYGEERPASIGSSESAWSENRRVELK